MKQEKVLFAVTLLIFVLMIAATLIVAVKYMDEEPEWNRLPNEAFETNAPEAGESPWLEVLTANLPPGMYTDTIILNNGGDGDAAD